MSDDLQAKFEAAKDNSKSIAERPDNDTLLELYSLFKQGSLGDATGKRPGALNFVGRAKFDAWANLKGTPPDEAKQRYIDLVDKLRGV